MLISKKQNTIKNLKGLLSYVRRVKLTCADKDY